MSVSTPDITASVFHAWLYECAVREMQKQLKLIADVGHSDNNEWKWGYTGAFGGIWRSLCLAGI
jgi:hypothetical protein